MTIKHFLSLFSLSLFLTIGFTASSIAHKSPPKQKGSVIALNGEINEQSADLVIYQIQTLQDDSGRPIALFINSGGGSVLDGGRIIDAMLASRRPIITVDAGLSASMAAWIFEYGQKRYMLPHSILMFHMASSSYSGKLNNVYNELMIEIKMMDSLNSIVIEKSHLPKDEVLLKERDEWWMMPEDALRVNLADAVIVTLDYPIPVQK